MSNAFYLFGGIGERFYSVMLSNEGSPGDLIRVISPMMQLESDSCLRFDVRLKAATLDLGLAKPNTPWLEQPMCTVAIPEHEAWQTVFIDLAEESDNTTNIVLFSVTFEPIAGEISYMQMDNITLFGSVCEDVIPQGRYIAHLSHFVSAALFYEQNPRLWP